MGVQGVKLLEALGFSPAIYTVLKSVWTSWLSHKSVHIFTHYQFSAPAWLLWFHGFAVCIYLQKCNKYSQKEALFNWYLSGVLGDKEK